MPFAKGQSGNPNGKTLDKPWREALRRALARSGGKNGGVAEGLDKIAAVVVKLAQEGDLAAIKEVADRLEGKAHQSVDLNVSNEQPVTELSDNELVRFIAARRAGSNGTSEEAEGASKPH